MPDNQSQGSLGGGSPLSPGLSQDTVRFGVFTGTQAQGVGGLGNSPAGSKRSNPDTSSELDSPDQKKANTATQAAGLPFEDGLDSQWDPEADVLEESVGPKRTETAGPGEPGDLQDTQSNTLVDQHGRPW